jgi:phospholipid transport system substrate-binding protein
MNKKHLAVILSILSLTYLGPQASAEAIPPDLLVKNTANEVLEIIKADLDVTHSDMNKIGKIVEEKIATKFDFDRMSQMVLGRSWKTASKSDQDQFIKEFKSLLVRTYSSKVDPSVKTKMHRV